VVSATGRAYCSRVTPLPVTALDALLLDAPTEVTASGWAAVLAEHRRHRAGPTGWTTGPLLLPDTALASAAADGLEGAGEAEETAVAVVNSSGAGGLVALARRRLPGLRLVAVESGLRDLDDLAGNAARVAAAAGALEEVDVYVGLPAAPGWLAAAEVVEAAGLAASLTQLPGPQGASVLAEQMSGLVEADLPFLVRRPVPPGPEPAAGTAALLLAVAALVDGAEPAEAARLLEEQDHDVLRAGFVAFDDATARRVRRRLRLVTAPTATTTAGWARLGLVAAG